MIRMHYFYHFFFKEFISFRNNEVLLFQKFKKFQKFQNFFANRAEYLYK